MSVESVLDLTSCEETFWERINRPPASTLQRARSAIRQHLKPRGESPPCGHNHLPDGFLPKYLERKKKKRLDS